MALKNLSTFLSVSKADLDSCIESIAHAEKISGIHAELRLHCLKLNGNGEPMVKALAEALYRYIIDYCLSCRDRPDLLDNRQAAKVIKEARSLFRHPARSEDNPDTSGEAGESLLFFLIEAILGAPQLVAKMELKTNSNDEVKGSDGIHARWNEDDLVVDFYFGEAKLYKSAGDAVSAALKSIDSFHESKMYKHEFTMITKHFKYADDEVRKAIEEHISLGEPGPTARINHACLIGYDCKHYEGTASPTNKQTIDALKTSLTSDSKALSELLNKRFERFSKKHLRFDFFFMPFPSVQEFRDAFNEALD